LIQKCRGNEWNKSQSHLVTKTDKTVGCEHQLHSTVGCESVDMVSEMSHVKQFYQLGAQMRLWLISLIISTP
jgi:hypothetical protein